VDDALWPDPDGGAAMTWLTAVAVVTLGLGLPGRAGEGVLVADGDEQHVLVWKTAQALREGSRLIRAQADIGRITPLVACAPAPGTPAMESAAEPSPALRGIVITSGRWAGCRGVIAEEHFRPR
jgi:hypothetical protein